MTKPKAKPRSEMTIQEAYDDLLAQRAELDRQITALKPFIEKRNGDSPTSVHPRFDRRNRTQDHSHKIPVGAFVKEHLSTDKKHPTDLGELAERLAKKYNLTPEKAKEKVKSSLKDLVKKGTARHTNVAGEYYKTGTDD